MVHSCSAFGCTNRFAKYKGIGFFRFPHDPTRRKLWGIALRRKGFEPKSTHRICGAHFQSGRPSLNPEDPDYIPNVFKFKNSSTKRKKQSRKDLKEDTKNVINKDIKIEDIPIDSELSSTNDFNMEEYSELKQKVLKVKTAIEQQSTKNVLVKEVNELIDSDAIESASENYGIENDDEFLSLKLELYEAYTDIDVLQKERDVLQNERDVLQKERHVLQKERDVLQNEKVVISVELLFQQNTEKILKDSVSEKETELSKIKKELQQAYSEINALRSEKDALQKKIESLDIFNRILQDARELFFYTGVHSTKDFHSILALLYDVDTSVKLFPMATQLLIVLMKLKLNFSYSDLSFRFQTSPLTVQKICAQLIPSLREKLELLIKSPISNALKKNLPPCYKNAIFESLYHRIRRHIKLKQTM